MYNKNGITLTYCTDSVYIHVTDMYIWMDAYCFHSMKQFFQLTWKSQQLLKVFSVIMAHINEQNILQLTYLLAVQLTLSLAGQLTLETF